jgi:G3E family GTPase
MDPAHDATGFAPSRALPNRIPIVLLTGFLGSGKTTLLRNLLTFPDWQRTAVLVNELGEIGLDHDLLWNANGATLIMENGCICCSVRDDLVEALEALFWKRLQQQVPRFESVVIETTGIADPAAIIELIFDHPLIAERYRLDSVLCTADALLGNQQLQQHPESRAQAACADVILMTKTDLAHKDEVWALEKKLQALNPHAPVWPTVAGKISPTLLQNLVPKANSVDRLARIQDWKSRPARAMRPLSRPSFNVAGGRGGGYLYHQRIRSIGLRFNRPWTLAELDAALQSSAASHGESILRIKGVVTVKDGPLPVLVQGMQHRIFPHEALKAWSGGSSPNFLVFIVYGLSDQIVRQAFASHLNVPAGTSPCS